MLINVKMPTNFGILIFMSMLNSCPVRAGLFLTVWWVDLQYVIVVFPDHTHLLFLVIRIEKNEYHYHVVVVFPDHTHLLF